MSVIPIIIKLNPVFRPYITLISALFIGYVTISAQDIHYSQFFNSPMNLSPSLTGFFNGDSRFYGNYRNQWANVPVDYTSATAGADFKFRNAKNNNYFALGTMINYDMAGDVNLSLTELNFFLAYSFQLGEKSSLSPAAGLSLAQRRFEPGNVTSGNQWDGRAFNPSIPAEDFGEANLFYFDLAAGIHYRWQNAYRRTIDLGVAAYHLAGPTQSFQANSGSSSPRRERYSAYALVNLPVSNGMDLLVNAVYTMQESYRERVANMQLKFYMGRRQSAAFYLGGGYRLDDAWYPMVALELGSVYGAFSYDFNISDFDEATDGRGGPEFSLRYIIAKIPRGIDKPCPVY
jgi:type IX secretion system PorP/SprF family membrane protein